MIWVFKNGPGWIRKREEGIISRWMKPEERSYPMKQLFYKRKLTTQYKKFLPKN